MASFFAEITLVQCQGICEEKENNHESFVVQSPDFPCDPFSVILEFIPVSGCWGCRGRAGEGGTAGTTDPGERWQHGYCSARGIVAQGVEELAGQQYSHCFYPFGLKLLLNSS